MSQFTGLPRKMPTISFETRFGILSHKLKRLLLIQPQLPAQYLPMCIPIHGSYEDALGLRTFVFDHDCREGICGMCSLYINGTPHGLTERGATTCQLYMRRFNDGDVITVEPWRSAAFPVIKDCMVDRGAFDKIIQAGGYTTIRTGQAQDANAILIPKEDADEAMDCATCIGCGACVAACKNGSAMLFVSSKVSQLALLPQGRVEAARRVKNMIAKMDELGFGNCTNTRACEAVCPKNESIANIARLNREMIKAKLAD